MWEIFWGGVSFKSCPWVLIARLGRLYLTPLKDLLPIPLRAMLHRGVDRHGLENEGQHVGCLTNSPRIVDPNGPKIITFGIITFIDIMHQDIP